VDALGQNIRGVTLDVGGTLISPHPSVGHVYASVAKKLGVGDFSSELLNKQFVAGWREKGFFDYSLENWRDLVKRSFAGIAPVTDELFNAIYEEFSHAECWRLYPDVLPLLKELKDRGVKIAAVSNWDTRLRGLLEAIDLAKHFDAIIVSAEVGATKPQKAIFEAALKALSLPAEHVLHIGDSEREDFQGARDAGMMSLLLSREEQGKVLTKAEAISDLSAVLRILDKPV